MITRIEIKGLRALRYVDVQLKSFQVFVGPNASGKSTFFDAIALVRDVLQVGVEDAVRGNIKLGVPMRAADPRDLTWRREGGPVEIAITADKPRVDGEEPGEVVRYEVALRTDGPLELLGENLWLISPEAARRQRDQTSDSPQRRLFPEEFQGVPPEVVWPANRKSPKGWRKIVSKSEGGNDYFRSETSKWNNLFRLGPTKSALANLPEDESRFPTAIWFKRWLMEGIHLLALDAGAMRLPAPAGSSWRLLPDGSNIAWTVHDLEEQAPDLLADWVEHLRTSLPDIKSVSTREKPEDRSRYLEVTYKTGLVAPSWLLSDGTLRMLALTLLAYLPEPPKLTLIEEPENGIHPRAVETVIQSLSSVYGGQVFCATHSPLVLSLIEGDQLLCFGKTQSGAVDVVRGSDHPKLRDWRAAVHLGDLLAMGVLG
ncbi:MAG: ATP-binding protein [Deferrisomatales bacterium]